MASGFLHFRSLLELGSLVGLRLHVCLVVGYSIWPWTKVIGGRIIDGPAGRGWGWCSSWTPGTSAPSSTLSPGQARRRIVVKERRRRKLRKDQTSIIYKIHRNVQKGERWWYAPTCLSQLMKKGLQGQGRGLHICAVKNREDFDTKGENCGDNNSVKKGNCGDPPWAVASSDLVACIGEEAHLDEHDVNGD